MTNHIDQLKAEYDVMVQYIPNNELSLLSDFNKNFRKVLLLASGSYLEQAITETLLDFFKNKSGNDLRIYSFLEKQALHRKYHTLFAWSDSNDSQLAWKSIKSFTRLFWEVFSNAVDIDMKIISTDSNTEMLKKEELKNASEAFLEIGNLRNILVHSNFAAYNYLDKTTDEIYELFLKANYFVTYLKEKFML